MRKIDLIVVHCSATRADQAYAPERLEADHLARGFLRAGYHFYVRRTGQVIPMRPLEMIPAHVKGYNRSSIGICYEGGLDTAAQVCDTRTPAQKEALLDLLKKLIRQFPGCRICGHRDLSPDCNGDGIVSPDEWIKACPSFDAANEYNFLTNGTAPDGSTV